MSYLNKAIKGVSFIFLNGVISAILSYLIRIIFAKNLSLNDYGLFYSVFTFILFFLIFKEFGLNNALARYLPIYKVQNENSKIKTIIFSTFFFQLLFSISIILLLFFLSDLLSTYYFKTSDASIIIKILSFYLILVVFSDLIASILQGFQDITKFSFIETIKNSFVLIVFLILIKLEIFNLIINSNIIIPTLSYILGTIIAIISMSFFLKNYIYLLKFNIRDFVPLSKELFIFGIPAMLTGFGDVIIAYVDTLILTYFSSYQEVGIYNVILPTAVMFLFIGKALASVVYPLIAELQERKEFDKIRLGLKLIYENILFFATVPFFYLFFFPDLLLNLLFGPDYVSGILAFRILLFGVYFYIIAIVNNSCIVSSGNPKYVTKIVFVAALLNLILNITLIPFLGIIGAAIATTLSYLIIFYLSTREIILIFKIKSPWNYWLKLMIFNISWMLCLFILSSSNSLILKLISFFVIFPISYILLGNYLGMVNLKELIEYFNLNSIFRYFF